MGSLTFLSIVLLTARVFCAQLKPAQLRYRLSQLECSPVDGFEPKPCRNLFTNKLIPGEECNSKKNTHCCIYNCTCILRGIGHPKGIIPESYKLPELPPLPLEGCQPEIWETMITKPSIAPATTTTKKLLRLPSPRLSADMMKTEITTAETTTSAKKPSATTKAAKKKPAQLRFRLSKLQCSPVDGFEPKPCRNLFTNKLIPGKECNSKKNTHCCIYNCTCILRGTGHPKGIIPEAYKILELTPLPLEGCQPEISETTITKPSIAPATTATKKLLRRRPSARLSPDMMKTVITTTETTTSAKKPCGTTKAVKNNTFFFRFYSRFAEVLSGIGFNVDVVPLEDCE